LFKENAGLIHFLSKDRVCSHSF